MMQIGELKNIVCSKRACCRTVMSAQRCFPKLEDSGDNQQQLEPATRQLSDIATLNQFISFLLDVKWYRHFHTEPCIHRHHASGYRVGVVFDKEICKLRR